METLCKSQCSFSFYRKKDVVVNFRGGEITTDAGLLPLREFDQRFQLTERMDDCISDSRVSYLIDHQQKEMLRQRLYQIVAGYEDVDDCDLLRNDAAMKLMADKKDLSKPLASQPTITRLENRVNWEEIENLNNLNLDWFINTREKEPEEIILDIDSTDDPAYGKQQLVLFNGFYGRYMYNPLLLFEGKSGHLLSVLLRGGTAHSSKFADEILKKTIDRLKEKFPTTKFYSRGDSGFGVPAVYELCEQEDVKYAFGIIGNSVLQRKAAKLLTKAKRVYKKTGKATRFYTSFLYSAKSWKRKRRICVKAECNSEGTNLRFIVTNMKGRSRDIFAFYNSRGECENRIKEIKNGFAADRLSCHTYLANSFRLNLHGLAYNLVNLFREKILATTTLAKAQIDTLRYKLFKIGAWVKESCRRIWVKLASGWPYRNLFRQIHPIVVGYGVLLRC